ncbi:hypothetical protein TNCV_3575221 [Trichonephila clavipes]|nr:hypothetical protein TNCV_3575221 [Trichonephila clavipes]
MVDLYIARLSEAKLSRDKKNQVDIELKEIKKKICEILFQGMSSGREKKKWDVKKRVENREGSLGYPGFVKPVLIKESKPLGKIGKDP